MRNRLVGRLLCTGLALPLFAASALAGGDPVAGKKKFYTCLGCHGIVGSTNSYPTYNVPRLGGQHPEYLQESLNEYRSGERKHPTMKGVASALSQKDMDDIIAYISRFRGMNQALPVQGDAEAGKRKSEACSGCHGADGNGNDGLMFDPKVPRIAGQYQSYLEQALLDYRTGKRKNPIMSAFASGLTEEDRQDLAAYYASQKKGLTLVEE